MPYKRGRGRDGARVDLFVIQFGLISAPNADGRFEPFLVVFLETIAPCFGLLLPLGRIRGVDPWQFKFWLVMSTATFIPIPRALDDSFRNREHIE